jgi:heme exporter protein D
MTAFFAMGGYGAFVWPAYAVTFIALAVTALMTWRAWRRAQARLAALEANRL